MMDRNELGRHRLSVRLLSRRIWVRRIVFWLGALFVGITSVGFAAVSNWSQGTFAGAASRVWWLPLVVTPLGFVLSSYLANRFVPAAQGSGIPQAMAARQLRSNADRTWLLAPRIVFGKIALTVLGLFSGASIGREGPTVQVGAGIMLHVARWGGLQQERGLILAGSAAGIAGAFNTPLAGIVFAIEEMSRAFEQRTNGLVLYAVIISGLVSLGLVGDYSYFGTTTATATVARDWFLVVACGVIGGLAGGGFSRMMLEGSRLLGRWTAPAPIVRSLVVAGVCGILVAFIGVASDGATFGTGYEQARSAVEGHHGAWSFWPAKLAATLITALSGIPGGIFAPSLSVGAGLGDWLGSLIGADTHGLVAVLGMAGYFAGVVQSPMTAFVIIMEMTNNQSNLIPLMVASIIGFAASKIVAPEPLYQALSKRFLAAKQKSARRGGSLAEADGSGQ